jgi:acetamidase/formamidase
MIADMDTGYDDYQIYLLLSCAPIQGHVAGIVDVSLAVTYGTAYDLC